jgi:hypothetical protein
MGLRKRIIKKIRSSNLPSCYSYKYRVKAWTVIEILAKQRLLRKALDKDKNKTI